MVYEGLTGIDIGYKGINSKYFVAVYPWCVGKTFGQKIFDKRESDI